MRTGRILRLRVLLAAVAPLPLPVRIDFRGNCRPSVPCPRWPGTVRCASIMSRRKPNMPGKPEARQGPTKPGRRIGRRGFVQFIRGSIRFPLRSGLSSGLPREVRSRETAPPAISSRLRRRQKTRRKHSAFPNRIRNVGRRPCHIPRLLRILGIVSISRPPPRQPWARYTDLRAGP